MHPDSKFPLSRRTLLSACTGAAGGVLLQASTPAAPAPGTGDWPCFRGPNRNGVISDRLRLLAAGPKQLWTAQVGPGHASMSIVGGRLYTFGRRQDNLVCLNARTGDKIWAKTLETHEGEATPFVENGRVYVQTGMTAFSAERPNARSAPTLYCCDANTGTELWKRKLPESTGDRQYGHAGSPVVWQDLVLLNVSAGAALKKSSGEIAWLHPGFPGLATPVLFNWREKACVALFGGDRLIARDARTGAELWQIPWKTSLAVNACDPIIFGEQIYICSDYGHGRALYDFSSGRPQVVWQFGQGRGSAFSSGFMHGGNLYSFAQGSFACLNLATGEPHWQVHGGTSALLVGDLLIRVREQGEIMFGRLTPNGHEALATAEAGMRVIKAVPAYWDGKLYLRNESGEIACFQIGTPA